MSRSLNPEQKQAIEAEAKQILVSAAAGSGKTTVLIERIKRLITEKRAPLSSMLIVTFTNAAAAEMRQRIAGALTAQLEKADDAFLRAQLSDIYNAHISTFHAFALDVIRTYYFKIGLAPDLRICDEAQRTLLRNETAEELFAARFEEEDPRFADFLDRYSDEKNDDALKEDILFAAYDAARVMPDPFGWLREKTQMPGKTREEILGGGLEKEIRRDVAAALSKIRTLCEQARGMLERGDAPARARLCGEDIIGLRDIQENADAMPLESLLARLKSFDFRRLAGKAEQEAYIRVEDDVKRVRGKAKKLLKDKLLACYCMQPLDAYIADINATAGQAAYLYELILDFDARFSRKKTEKGLMDFADAEHYALRILDDEEAAAEYRARFRYIFIDEYQDCNLMQDSLIRRISGDADVFMVGDVKQSIYKFRLAEPELFTAKYEAFQRGETPGGLLIDLNQNYRSKAPVIDAVNAIFSRIMTPETADIRYDENAALKKGLHFDDEARRNKDTAFYVIDDSPAEEEAGAPEPAETSGESPGTQDEAPETPDETQEGGEAAKLIAEMKKTELDAAAAAKIVKVTLYAPDGT
ncbi:MAG: UvrD-helicase domain-containing protein, partial [Clostridiales Family XIII bacterium]|nr:UvrD-helicase domain-containing protein [Clostridiales Family XIII bacterium]